MDGYTHCRYTRVIIRNHEEGMTKQINIMNEVGEDIPRGLLITTSGLVNFLKSLKSFYEFEELMLPSEISIPKLYTTLKFISPQIILAHGSYITKVRYSPEGSPDLDITIVSIKIPFWSKEVLYKEIQDKLSQLSKSIKFDVSLVTPRGLLAHIYGKTSLGQSILQGFTILYFGEGNGHE